MAFLIVAVISGVGLLVLMLGAAELGRRIGGARLARGEGLVKGAGAAEAATFALFGLLVAFTFSGAASRFEDRRHLIAAETNAIGTAYLRLDLLPSDAQPPLRDLFRRYAEVRYRAYRQALDAAATGSLRDEGVALQGQIWQMSVAALERPEARAPAATLVIAGLNDMIDMTTTREMANINHPPPIVYALLGVLSFVCALLVGYGTSHNTRRSWLHTLTFAAIVSVTVYVILDLEYPRVGLIRVDAADEVLGGLREVMR